MEKKFRILLATDYSEAVMNAERYAVQFAKNTNSILTIIHVVNEESASILANSENLADSSRYYLEQEQERMEHHRDKLFASLNIDKFELESDCIIRVGLAGEQICKEAKREDIDFIIAGTHGATGFRKVFYGTHAWEIIRKSSVPVIAVPKDGMFTSIKNIVFAAEQREGEMAAINYLAQFAELFDATITVLHVTNYSVSKELEIKMFEKFRAEIMDRLGYKKINLRLAHYEDIIQGINDFSIRTKADLIVMSPEKKSLLEKIFMPVASVTKEMSFQTHIPLLSIPDYYDPENSAFWKLFELDENYLTED